MATTLKNDGFKIINGIYSETEVTAILQFLEKKQVARQFGVRAFLKSNPELNALIFNKNLLRTIANISKKAQIIKSIYFDKPPNANWIVNWHQDLTINVTGKIEVEGFKNWRVLKDRTVVQPPLAILENIFTVRIHLDKCTKENGALRVLKNTHQNGVIEVKNGVQYLQKEEVVCQVEKGGILLIKPLILHSSRRTENDKNRRVIHIEFCDMKLPRGLNWQEAQQIWEWYRFDKK